MLEKISLDVINTTLESFEKIISEIEGHFIKSEMAGEEYLEDLLVITIDYRKDVINFLRSLYVIQQSFEYGGILDDCIVDVEDKIIYLDSIIEKYSPQTHTVVTGDFVEFETNIYS